jgi:uncharacterized damage-inducible protein DinB
MTPADFLSHLSSVHGRTERIIAAIPRDDFDWSAAPGRFSFADQIRHLANIERWMYGETVQGKPSRYQGHGKEFADGPDAVLAYYKHLHEESRRIFESIPESAWGAKVLTPAGTPITLWKWLRAMLEHEAHHRGQIYFMLGLRGVKTPPLYGLTSEEVAAKSLPASP